jgi:hypothetical protein
MIDKSKKISFNSHALMAIPYATFCPASAPDRQTIGGDAVALEALRQLRIRLFPNRCNHAAHISIPTMIA